MLKKVFRSKTFLLVALVTVLAFLLRIYRLDLPVPTLYSDEVDLHYKTLGWFFRDNVPFIQKIFDYIFNGLFTFTWFTGLNALGVRLPSALYMSISVFLMYFFAKNVAERLKLPSNSITVLAVFGMAFLPWSFVLSRIGFTHIAILLLIIMIHLILYIKAKNFNQYIWSLVPLLLAVYYYQSMIVAAPFILLMMFFQIRRIFKRKELIRFVIASILFMLCLIAIFLFRPNYSDVSVGARGLDIAIWRDVNVTSEVNEYRGLARRSEPTAFSFFQDTENISNKINYNSFIAIINNISKNYFVFFSPEFLFLKGDPVLRHSTGQVGVLYGFLAPFLVLGVFSLATSKDKKIKWMFLTWILVSPIATSLTKDGYGDLIRVVSMMPFLTYLCAQGIIVSYLYIKKFRFIYSVCLVLIAIFSVYYFLFGYFHVFPLKAAKDFEYGFKELSDIQSNESTKLLNNRMLVIWGGYYPHWHFRFWQKTPFKEYESFAHREELYGKTKLVQKFPNLFFAIPQNLDDFEKIIKEKDIMLVSVPPVIFEKYSMQFISKDFTMDQEVKYPNGDTAFYVFSKK